MNARTTVIGFVAAIALLSVNFANANPVVIVGNHDLLADTPNQTIDIMVEGGDEVQGLNLRAQIEDGGPYPETGGSILGPAITEVDILNETIFDGNNSGQRNVLTLPQVAVSSTTTETGTVAAGGLLARITFDTTGFTEGSFTLTLENTLDGSTDFAGVDPETISDGMLNIVPVPEPNALALCLLGITISALRLRVRR